MKQQLKADASGAGDFSADRSTASKMISIANPMNAGSTMMGKVTGSNKYKAHDGAPLYFPSAKSAALRSHSGVKSVIPPRARALVVVPAAAAALVGWELWGGGGRGCFCPRAASSCTDTSPVCLRVLPLCSPPPLPQIQGLPDRLPG